MKLVSLKEESHSWAPAVFPPVYESGVNQPLDMPEEGHLQGGIQFLMAVTGMIDTNQRKCQMSKIPPIYSIRKDRCQPQKLANEQKKG